MNKTSIEWVRNPDGTQGYTWNVITGCLNHTDGLCKGGNFPCYAYRLANGRLRHHYKSNRNTALPQSHSRAQLVKSLDPFYPRFWEERLHIPEPPLHRGYSSRVRAALAQNYRKGIFVCDMGDLFGIGIPESWTQRIMSEVRMHPEHRFYLLTKQAEQLVKWSPFPENAWVGVTATQDGSIGHAESYLSRIQAEVKYISIEPMLERMIGVSPTVLNEAGINWLIIGACTGSASGIGALIRRYPDLVHKPLGNKWTAQPRIEWVREIIEACQKASIPYFLKDNLRPLLGGSLVQDMPKGVEIGH